MDLCGIKTQNTARLNRMGIYTVVDFYKTPVWKLKAAFESINGYYWYVRLHGWEIDDVEFARHSFGNSYALPNTLTTPEELAPLVMKLVEKTGIRMRRAGYWAKGVHLVIVYRDLTFWHRGKTLPDFVFDSRDIYKKAFHLLLHSPYRKPVRELAVSCFNLQESQYAQISLLEDTVRKERLVEAVDRINEKFGDFVITPGRMLGTDDIIIDRVSFENIRELEDKVLAS